MQICHSNAKTNIHIREQIKNNPQHSVRSLAEKHGVSTQTVAQMEKQGLR